MTMVLPGKDLGQDPTITRSIPSSGEKLPAIGMGTWRTFDTN